MLNIDLFRDVEARWAAVLRQDPRADTAFFYAVITTGIYCRPICTARRPKRENVRFFDDARAAEGAGFRACKRCRPRAVERGRATAVCHVRPAGILFIDIHGFTKLARRMAPSEALELLRAFHTRMASVVNNQGGIVHQYLGDGLMALFGAERSRATDASGALGAGLMALDAVADWNQERIAAAESPIRIGVGVHYGTVAFGATAAGSGGSRAVTGDAVNVASRLEKATRRLGCGIVASDDAVRALPADQRRLFREMLTPLGALRLRDCLPRRLWNGPAAAPDRIGPMAAYPTAA